MLFTYFVVMLLSSLVMVFGSTLVFSKNLEDVKQPLTNSMKRYDPTALDKDSKDITDAWDKIQVEVKLGKNTSDCGRR